ncbi:hypothetical protein ROZALSC1DRAFT_27322 [Rozella allomycis CSF55]|uniref:Uncharacterized protein n=1 Tax=Rozella allomycis (strain CSF55) TaxID=988480 RepID=A0A4V1J0E2_ROZAC|nr:hypothetical protein ROZALSC1DRAFT_27322 [Rozella allomycis CSF55]
MQLIVKESDVFIHRKTGKCLVADDKFENGVKRLYIKNCDASFIWNKRDVSAKNSNQNECLTAVIDSGNKIYPVFQFPCRTSMNWKYYKSNLQTSIGNNDMCIHVSGTGSTYLDECLENDEDDLFDLPFLSDFSVTGGRSTPEGDLNVLASWNYNLCGIRPNDYGIIELSYRTELKSFNENFNVSLCDRQFTRNISFNPGDAISLQIKIANNILDIEKNTYILFDSLVPLLPTLTVELTTTTSEVSYTTTSSKQELSSILSNNAESNLEETMNTGTLLIVVSSVLGVAIIFISGSSRNKARKNEDQVFASYSRIMPGIGEIEEKTSTLQSSGSNEGSNSL